MKEETGTYPSIAYSVVEKGLICFVADVGGLVELGTVIRCVLEYLCGGDGERVLRRIRGLSRGEKKWEGSSRGRMIVG